ncbi:hypothetical protein FocTR4_00016857 [Fusarium oxysporum f. sp. cubense]|uniref:Uncharacterized protein n=1 Tax=Fusarium oxysporum f. sp. cubense TaxID=61366 RepID=A0A5C6SI61_FUSOC|nr:hypothetical protein FocTR4_00016857 [Fusarium oxysporum f. sp. cubense]
MVTATGVIFLAIEATASTEPAISSQASAVLTLGLRGDTRITMGGKDLFWLPSECRGGETAVSGHLVVVGCPSGRVVFFGISASEIAKL